MVLIAFTVYSEYSNFSFPMRLREQKRHIQILAFRLRFLQNGISERKVWNHLAVLPESDESSKVALFVRLPKVAPGEIIFFVEW